MVVLDERLVARIEEALQLREALDAEAGDGAAAAAGQPGLRALADDPDDDAGDDEQHEGADAGAVRRARAAQTTAEVRDERNRSQSSLTPREVQARLRAGYSIADVAAEAGVGEEWVARFAAPIMAEQQQVLDRARGLVFTAPRKGESSLPLGASVQWAVAERGVGMSEAEFERAWSAYQLRDGSWVVRFAYTSRRREQHADWQVDLRHGGLTSLNRLATDLGYVGKGYRQRRVGDLPAPEVEAPVVRPVRRPSRPAARPLGEIGRAHV